MKEIRITLRGEDFVAMSKYLIDLGVGFQVEPVQSGHDLAISAGRTERPSITPRRPQAKRRSAKTGGRVGTMAESAGRATSTGDRATRLGAHRLRAIVERNQAAVGRASPDVPEPETEDEQADKSSSPPLDTKT